MSFAKIACVIVLIAGAGVASASLEQRQTTIVQRFPVAAAQVSEAPEGHSDNNWLVRNLVDGRWGTPPFYPDQQWMARHLGEPGFDIWCRLDFGQPRDVCMIRLQNSQLGSFVCIKDISLEFEGGVRVPITLEHNRVPQTFRFPVARSSYVIVHLLNHYGDGTGIDVNSGGLAEVEVFGMGRGVAERTTTPGFTVARKGNLTTWLLAAGAMQAETAAAWPVEWEASDEAKGLFWEMEVSPTAEVHMPAGRPGLAFCSLRSTAPRKCRLQLHGAELLRVNGRSPDGTDLAILPDAWTDVLLRVTSPSFTAKLLGQTDGVRVGLGWYKDATARQRAWLESIAQLRPARHFIRPGEKAEVVGIPDDVGYPCFPVERMETRSSAARLGGGSGTVSLQAGLPLGRYVVTTELWPFGITRTSALTVNKWATDGRPVPKGFTDLNGDGHPDVLRTTIRGYDCLIIDDDGDMTKATTDRDLDSDAILVDKDGDGIFDGDNDFYYDAVDIDHDGDPDVEYYNADQIVKTFLDLDDDNILTGSLDWHGFNYGNEMAHTGSTGYLQDVNGAGYFHNTRIWEPDLRYAWETPIAWYDFTGRGFTDMVMRVTELGERTARAEEFEIAFNIDADGGPDNPCDLDFQVTYQAVPPDHGPDFSDCVVDFPQFRGLPESELLFTTNYRLRTETRRIVFPYATGYAMGTRYKGWDSCFLIYDEDDEDQRWEEMFGINEADWAPYSDHCGDRVEEDLDFSGGGRMYRAAFDGKWHLLGADKSEWLIDYYGLYHGCCDRLAPEDLPMPPPSLRFPRVRYEDTNHNGFIDRVLYDDDGDPTTWERTVNLLDYGSDVCELIDLAPQGPLPTWTEKTWDGKAVTMHNEAWTRLHERYLKEADADFAAARALYDAAKAGGLTKSEMLPEATLAPDLPIPQRKDAKTYLLGRGYATLLTAPTPALKYRNAYFLREKVLADMLDGLPEKSRAECKRMFYTGQIEALAKALPRLLGR